MKTLVLLLFSVMALAKSVSNAVSSPMQTLVIIGDSLTEGYGVKATEAYPAVLEQKLIQAGKNWKVLNYGTSGATSASAASKARWVLKKPPQIALLALGANDGLRGLDPTSTEKNLDQAIRLLKEAKVKVIIAGMKMPPNYRGKMRDQFDKIFSKLANKHHIQLIPFLLEGVAGVPSLNQKDGIHPNAQGHAIIAETIYKFILPEL